jgi:hypothetical protein
LRFGRRLRGPARASHGRLHAPSISLVRAPRHQGNRAPSEGANLAPPLTIGALARPGRRSHIIGCVRYANTSWRREWTVRRTAAIAPASWRSPVNARVVRHYVCLVVSPVIVQRCQA